MASSSSSSSSSSAGPHSAEYIAPQLTGLVAPSKAAKTKYDLIVVGGGPAGAALSTVMGRKGKRVLVIERDWAEPDRIIGELLQPGGVQSLRNLGLDDCLEGIDAPHILGYSIFLDGERQPLRYPFYKNKPREGRSFHHGRFIQQLRLRALMEDNVDGLSATVTGLVEESGIVRGVRFRDQDNKSYEVYSKLTVVCDGSGSVLRKKVSDGPSPCVRSHFVALMLENAADKLPYPWHGHVMLVKPSPVLAYPISSTDVRVLVDMPGKLLSIGSGEMQEYLANTMCPQLAEEIQPFFLDAVKSGRIRAVPNREMPSGPSYARGAILLGDAFNCRHPLTGGGMTVVFSDVKLLSDMLGSIKNLDDYKKVERGLKKFYEKRKGASATINILAGALYSVFAASDDPALPFMRKACFDYFKLGGVARDGPLSLLSGLNPSYYKLIMHFFAVALYGVAKQLVPIPTPSRIIRSFRIIRAATRIVQPLIRKEKILNWVPDIPI